jgi:uncharacterized Ntn-hydrolase superfamily protein
MRPALAAAAVLALLAGAPDPPEVRTNTWSIVCVDSRTREVAVAGASCVPDVSIIASTIPDVGAAATQALYSGTNRLRVEQRMQAGDSPQDIIAFVNGLDMNYQTRQYGIATLAHGVANFTGTSTSDWKGAAAGSNVTVQGNLLQGAAVVGDALSAFQDPALPLVDRLLAALRAGQAAGGDARCAYGADSAFVRIVRPEGTYCDLKATADGTDPIARLARQVAAWKQGRAGQVDAWASTASISPPAIPADGAAAATLTVTLRDAGGTPLPGRAVTAAGQGLGTVSPFAEPAAGTYTASVTSTAGGSETFTVQAGGVSLGDKPGVTYTGGAPPSPGGGGDGGGGGGCGLLGLEALIAGMLARRRRSSVV